MRDDFVPPAISISDKLSAALERERRLAVCMQRWNALAKSMGYDGVQEALESLNAMKRGPRPL